MMNFLTTLITLGIFLLCAFIIAIPISYLWYRLHLRKIKKNYLKESKKEDKNETNNTREPRESREPRTLGIEPRIEQSEIRTFKDRYEEPIRRERVQVSDANNIGRSKNTVKLHRPTDL